MSDALLIAMVYAVSNIVSAFIVVIHYSYVSKTNREHLEKMYKWVNQ